MLDEVCSAEVVDSVSVDHCSSSPEVVFQLPVTLAFGFHPDSTPNDTSTPQLVLSETVLECDWLVDCD